jgi:3',5'-cyclic-AMP phosphodiesterase
LKNPALVPGFLLLCSLPIIYACAMKFIHFTDLHLVQPGEKLWGFEPVARLKLCLADLVKFHADAAFCVISGDLADRGEMQAYENLKEILRDFPIETHLMIGNHDDRENYFKIFGGSEQSKFVQHHKILNGQHFLLLDTLKGGSSSAGLLDEERCKWLRARLAITKGAPTYIFMHHPPFKIHHPLMDLIPLEDGESFGELLQGYNVRHIFFGHAHRTISGQWRGITFSALPSLNHQLPLVGGSVATVYSDEPPSYSVVYINGTQITVHSDAFMNRARANMSDDAERGNWS